MKRLLLALAVVAVLVFAASALLAAPAAAAATAAPPPPPASPSAYVRTTDFTDGCTDWSLQSNWPFSVANPKWVFSCTNTSFYDWYDPVNYPNAWWQGWDRYYWNADTQKAILWDYGLYDAWIDWYSDCPFGFAGACQA